MKMEHILGGNNFSLMILLYSHLNLQDFLATHFKFNYIILYKRVWFVPLAQFSVRNTQCVVDMFDSWK